MFEDTWNAELFKQSPLKAKKNYLTLKLVIKLTSFKMILKLFQIMIIFTANYIQLF